VRRREAYKAKGSGDGCVARSVYCTIMTDEEASGDNDKRRKCVRCCIGNAIGPPTQHNKPTTGDADENLRAAIF